jgi:hypothetical protein
MSEDESIAQRVMELKELDEAKFLAYFHQLVDKSRQKTWYDRHIKAKTLSQGDKVLLYDRQYQKHQGKLRIHFLGPFIVAEI